MRGFTAQACFTITIDSRRQLTQPTREAALRQLHRLNRWLIAGSVVLTGVFAEAAAHAFPGKTTKTTSASKVKRALGHTRRAATARPRDRQIQRTPEMNTLYPTPTEPLVPAAHQGPRGCRGC